jgi:hypothetical protein
MIIPYMAMMGAAAFVLAVVPARAGPCSQEIERMQAQVDASIAVAISLRHIDPGHFTARP